MNIYSQEIHPVNINFKLPKKKFANLRNGHVTTELRQKNTDLKALVKVTKNENVNE